MNNNHGIAHQMVQEAPAPAPQSAAHIDDRESCECGRCGFKEEINETHRDLRQRHSALVNRSRRLLLSFLNGNVISVVHHYLAIDWQLCACRACVPIQTPTPTSRQTVADAVGSDIAWHT